MCMDNHIVLLYTAGIHHPSIVSIQSIMRYHTLDTNSVFPLEQGMYVRCVVVVCTIIIAMNAGLTIIIKLS